MKKPATPHRKLPKPKPKPARKPGHSTGSPVTVSRSLPAKKSHHAAPHKPQHPHKPVRAKRKQPARKLSPGAVACCPAEAVAAAAQLAGWPVTGSDVLDLYARCADGTSSGFTIAVALTAAKQLGVAGFDLIELGEVMSLDASECWLRTCAADRLRVPGSDGSRTVVTARAGLILGVDLPGPHAVTIAPDGCWVSWGQHYDAADFPAAVIEEAWTVMFA